MKVYKLSVPYCGKFTVFQYNIYVEAETVPTKAQWIKTIKKECPKDILEHVLNTLSKIGKLPNLKKGEKNSTKRVVFLIQEEEISQLISINEINVIKLED